MIPIIQLAEKLKPHIVANSDAKALVSDSLTILGQVQYQLSVRRRYMIRPNLKKKYQSLCNISTPISTKLFGDDIAKDIKNCDSMAFLGRDQAFQSSRMHSFRGRAGGRVSRRPYYGNSYGGYSQTGYGMHGGGRYQPYPQPYQQQRGFRPAARGRVTRRSATATATGPNDQH